MSERHDRLVGTWLILLAATCYATLGPLTRLAEAEGVATIAFVSWRAGVGALLIAAVVVLHRIYTRQAFVSPRALPTRTKLMLGVAGVATVAVNLFLVSAFTRLTVALALLVFYLYPALVAAISAVWFSERLTRAGWLALALALAGVGLVVAGPLGTIDPTGIVFAFAAAVSGAVWSLAARHGFSAVPTPQATALLLGFAAIAFLTIALASGRFTEVWRPAGAPTSLLLLLLAGFVAAGIPAVASMAGVRRIGPPRASILMTFEPVAGIALAALLLAEVPTSVQVAGGALILSATLILQVEQRRIARAQA